MEINGILDSWSCFGKNPRLATRVLMDQVSATVSHANPVRHVLELEKSGYLEDTRTLAIGTAMLYSIAFSAMYAIIYMTYGVFWF
ncbi:hypothetical protein C4E24_07735 [ANME-1 cluster archaeon AG-394-G21]|jgi:hypothetical protein|nr:hypothetical protein [ANME-1 cluster archaeon AG-394-G21]